ncbi:efflux transporter outer membrane subunit [Roseateles depolymerans]|uniref:Efflux transporter, outer membrane factor lipoprotein, NodT family n=1 Tax=Roseateles depolymerans TaxID=76731 RepID=A0A0U3MRG4_9BURK|nr:efflux transporter outer membrane subunit [Roseateles depolymerans]ALV06874.1 Efflux transporter, outer membrane factor lipoprotein, NodT family [Roseateles depolymerans]REG19853.1 NodT family efflux transporter outer membrane factor (OMF) lipoprotein [Roseateles depolymerans]
MTPRSLHRTTLALAMGAALLLVLAACAPIPKLEQPGQTLDGDIAARQLGLTNGSGQAVDQQWWKQFGDAQLDALVDQAMAQSPSLALARARIARAAAMTENAEANERPNAALDASVTRQRITENGIYPVPLAGSIRTFGNVQAGLSYEWDFFGRHEAELKAALGQKRAAEADAAAARLSVANAITKAYVALARSQAQSRLLQEQVALRQQGFELVRQRSEAGLDNTQELRQAEAPLPDLQRQQLVLQEQQTLLRNQIAALTGQGPSGTATLQATLPRSLDWQQAPSLDLLGRRPDLAAARARVEASAQDVRAARTRFYPSVSLSAFVGLNAIGLDELFKSGSRQWGGGPALSLPLFDAGHLRANLRGSAAEQDAAIASYNAAVLDAVRDASDQFASLQSLRQQQTAQDALVANADSQYSLAQQRFQAGLVNRLAVINAQQSRVTQQRGQLDLQAQTVDAQINLIRALGGGYADPATQPSASASTSPAPQTSASRS